MSDIRFDQYSLGECAQAPYPTAMKAIHVEGLTKRYGDVLAVDDIAFDAPAGSTIGLLGGNGAGKTTTIAMLLGLLLPTSGRIVLLGHDMAKDRFAALARMNFSSPYISLPSQTDRRGKPAGLLATCTTSSGSEQSASPN